MHIFLIFFIVSIQLSRSQNCSCNSEILGNGYCDHQCNTTSCNFDSGDCLPQTPTNSSESSSEGGGGASNGTVLLMSIVMGLSFGLFWLGCILFYVCKKFKAEHKFEVVTASLPSDSGDLYQSSGRRLIGYTWIEHKYPLKYFSDEVRFKGEPVCTVCLMELFERDPVRVINCWHIFHSQCIDEWIMTSESLKCPNCNSDF
ncbi:unnamed protein product [Blepharisma stoltei]|uniref:RING-type domain-containing protein n=1 Tax=Blepharisma stoltei TaxID=1481888 RepID=A0AAU9JE26_9CILI|nr:unnamed protein product [Blepharisma stoltei]